MATNKRSPVYYGFVVLGAAFLIAGTAWGAQRTFGIFLDPLLSTFGWARGPASLTVTIQMLVTGIMGIVAGRLSDKFGPKIVLTGCGLIVGIGFMLSYFIHNLWQLWLLQGVFVGIGLAGVMIPLTSCVIRWFKSRAGFINGIVFAGVGAGMVFMPLMASWLIHMSDPPAWRRAYFILGIIVLVIMVTAAQFLRRATDCPEPVDEDKKKRKTKLSVNPNSFTLSEALKTKTFWLLGALWFVDLFNVNVVMVHIVKYAEDQAITATVAASILALTSAVSIGGRVFSGFIGDRFGIKFTIARGLFTVMVAFIFLLFVKSLWGLYVFAILIGFGGWSVGAVNSPLVAEYFGYKSHGIILGAVTFVGTLGGAIGPLIAGFIFDQTNSYNLMFVVSAIIPAIGILLIIFLKKPAERKHDEQGRIT
jgi:MFS family permease